MNIEKILIVDDEILIRNFLAETLKRKNYDVTTAQNGQTAFALLKANTYDLVITDMKMPDTTGIEVLRKVKTLSPATTVIIITAFGSIENAVEAMRLGAFNYLIKPFSPDTIEAIIEKAEEHQKIIQENTFLRQQVTSGDTSNGAQVIAESPAMKKIMQDALQIAKSNANVFITGESGSGKEVVARAIHMNSLRAKAPYIRVNCAALPESLIESELFGHEKGAFTGAQIKRIGRFELAHGGSLLLDEVTEIPLALQAKLLRVVQEQEFERIGGMKSVQVNVRLIATSNRNMQEAIADKMFREDLYYRLNVIPIYLPPLRERPEDIIALARHFLEKFSIGNHKPKKSFSGSAEKKLLEYRWPGNIRELANVIERAVVMDLSTVIDAEHLYTEAHSASPAKQPIMQGMTLAEMEKQMILETFATHQRNQAKTAEILGISLRTLKNKLKEYQWYS